MRALSASRKLENSLPGNAMLQALSIPTHCWKGTSYDSILVVIDWFTKMVHSKPVQMIDAPGLAKVFIDLIVRHHGLSNSRLNLDLQVLVPAVPLSSSTAVTTYASSIRTSRNDCMQREPSGLACDIANPFPPDLWGYVHGFSY